MKLRNLLLAMAFTAIGSTSFAFNLIIPEKEQWGNGFPTHFQGTQEQFTKIKDYILSWEKYEISFEMEQSIMAIKCPYDGGITSYSVSGNTPVFIKSTDKCKHELVVKIKDNELYRDYVPFLIAEDYCGWKQGKHVAFAETWKQYGKPPVKAVK